ncbi:MAG: hypothetical protein EXS38_08935 [Opitutus sp.]|nr:hypothetical protein [Opitutus sp.]
MSLLRWLPLALLGAVLTVAGASLLFSTFMMYDDEGYVLFSLHEFVTGGGLYERVYSQYGPFFFLFNQALHFGGLEFNNIGGRLLTLACWLGAAGFSGAAVWRMSRSTAATGFTLGGVFLHLWPMVSEPSHPGGLIVLVTAAIAWAGVQWIARPRRLARAVGVAGAALLLTKINVGIFLFAGAGAWWALHLDEKVIGQRGRTGLIGGAMALLPFVLMRGQMNLEWVRIFVVIAAAAGAATVLAVARGAEPVSRWGDLGALAVPAIVVIVVTCAGILVQGTSPRGLLEGVVLGPLRHPLAYTAYVKWRFGVVPLALLALGFAGWLLTRPLAASVRFIALGRLVAAAVFFSTWALDWSLNTHAFALSYGLTAIWLFAYPLDANRTTQPARAWLALLVVTQALHAFPVAGSQISWGTFLWIPLAALGVHDVARVFAVGAAPARRRWLTYGAAALLVATTVRCANYAWLGLSRLRLGDTLALPGAAALRLPENFTTLLRVLARNATAHADVLFSLPGLHSFHLWTDVPPPTTINATHWFTLLSPAQQEAIRVRLAAAPRSCVIVQRNLYDYLVQSKVATESPLTVWFHANYEKAFSLETYEFWVRRGRTIAAFNTATVREGGAGTAPRYQLALTLAESTFRGVVSIELARFDGDISTPVATWTNADAALFVTPIYSTGREAGAARLIHFPFDAPGLVRLELRTDRFPPNFLTDHGVVYLRNAAGQRLAEARFIK